MIRHRPKSKYLLYVLFLLLVSYIAGRRKRAFICLPASIYAIRGYFDASFISIIAIEAPFLPFAHIGLIPTNKVAILYFDFTLILLLYLMMFRSAY